MSAAVETISHELSKRWPGKYGDEELVDFADRLSRFDTDAVIGALESHKNGKPFKPAVSEIIGRLKGKEVKSDAQQRGAATEFPTHAEHLSRAMRFPLKEAVMRYWRQQWTRYDIAHRDRIKDVKLPEQQQAFYEQQRSGYHGKCTAGCVGDLVSCGVALEQAQRAAAFIDALRPAFESCVNEFKAEEVPDFSEIS